MSEYTPINCSFYDYLELYAMRKTEVQIRLKNGEIFIGRIANLLVRDKAEWLIPEEGEHIRLDEIVSVQPQSKEDQEVKL
jgi:transcriptional antiterminator Rof (Rho-off)